MISQSLSSIKDVAIYAILPLLIFFTFFVGVIVYMFSIKKEDLKEMESIPFDHSAEHENN